MKKSIKILNFGSSKYDEILNAGRTDKIHVGLGYTREPRSSQTVFVKASTSEVKIHDDLKHKASVSTPAKTLAVTQARRHPEDLNQIRNRRKIPISHYCNKRGHIRPRCY